jgi:hypothetical protein
MNFVEAISSCFRNYANFSGRAVRSEYWYWYLFVAIVLIVFGAIDDRGAAIGHALMSALPATNGIYGHTPYRDKRAQLDLRGRKILRA